MGKLITVVGAAIVHDGRILAAQRGPGRPMAGYWEFPGGKTESQETARAALEREIREELHCTISVRDEVCTSTYDYDFGTVQLTVFICTLVEGTPRLTEHSTITWVTPAQMGELDWAPADREAVEILAAATFQP